MSRFRSIWMWFKNQFTISKKLNIKVVILCFVGASTFWFFNSLNKDYTSDIKLPINFQYDETEHIVLGELPSQIEVNVSGIGWDMLRKTNIFSSTPMEIQLSDPVSQKKLLGASLEPFVNSYLDGQLELNYVITDTLHLDIDRRITRTIKLVVDSASIDLADDYELVSAVNIGADSLWIEGPRMMIDTLSSPYLIKLPDAEINGDYDERIGIPLDDMEYISCEPQTVRVRFEVAELLSASQKVSYQIANFPDQDIVLSDSLVEVSYKVREQFLDSVRSELEILVDYNLVSWDDSTVMPVIRDYPPFIRDALVISDPLKLTFK